MAIEKINLGESAINSLMKRKEARTAFNFLKHPPTVVASSCSSCGGRRTTQLPDYNWIKRKLAALGPEDRKVLKTLLNVNRIQISFWEDKKRRIVHL